MHYSLTSGMHVGRTSHARVMEDFGQSFEEGDIIGCYMNLESARPDRNDIRFFKNGVDQGQAYTGKEIPLGVYFPAVSLYGGVMTDEPCNNELTSKLYRHVLELISGPVLFSVMTFTERMLARKHNP
jgi:hypothetical protein